MELIQINIEKIMQSRAYTVIILSGAEKKFAIYTDPIVGRSLQLLLTNEKTPRPYTHNLIASMFTGFEIRLKQIVINKVEDTVYFSRLFLEQQTGDERQILEIDARPSDCFILALMHNAPLYAHKDVVTQAVPVE